MFILRHLGHLGYTLLSLILSKPHVPVVEVRLYVGTSLGIPMRSERSWSKQSGGLCSMQMQVQSQQNTLLRTCVCVCACTCVLRVCTIPCACV